ncbi:MAG: LPS export ABC transporter periplasmic protein LptC [Pseudomonadota bacterium]
MDTRNLAGFVVLLGLAGATYYLANSQPDDSDEELTTPQLENGFYLRAARILGTGPDGQPLYEVEAEYAEQRGDNNIEFDTVRVIYTPESGVPWTLNADSALISNDQQLLVLEGRVVAVSTDGLDGEVTEIRTPYLELLPDEYRAETDERVQVRIGARSLTATGMLASLRDNRFRLKSNVSGKFVP